MEEAERLYSILSKLTPNTIVIVEGESDRRILTQLPFIKAEIITLRELHHVDFKDRDVLILTDFDKEGYHLEKRVKSYLSSNYPDANILDGIRQALAYTIGRWGEVYAGIQFMLRRGYLEKYIRYHDIDWEY